MLRSIVVPLDGSASSVDAGRLAIALGARHAAHVEALGIVNAPHIQRPQPVPIGGIALKKAFDLKTLASARERVDAVIDLFHGQAETANLASFETKVVDGDPLVQIEREATTHDLVVLGSGSLFDIDGELFEMSLCVDRIIRREPRPVLLVPKAANGAPDGKTFAPVLVAFDGSPAASRTLHMLALLGIARERAVHVLTVDNRSKKAAAATAAQACELLKRHGVAQTHPIALDDVEAGTPAETILGMAKGLGAGMIAMGAYGHSGIRELFGSCTRAVLANSPQKLFLHH